MNEALDRRTREVVEAERVVPPLAAGARDRIRARVRSTRATATSRRWTSGSARPEASPRCPERPGSGARKWPLGRSVAPV